MDPVTRYYGIYRGVVKDNNDSKKQRRLKILITQITGNEVTDWAWPVEPSSISTDVPAIGQGVWVSFIGGDLGYPVWSGAFGKNQGKNKKIFIKSLANTVSLTGLTAHVITVKQSDGTTEVDLISTIVALANKVKSLETRMTTAEGKITTLEGKVSTLESTVSTLKSTLATRTTGGHTHTTNG
jgi:hypothetical protein